MSDLYSKIEPIHKSVEEQYKIVNEAKAELERKAKELHDARLAFIDSEGVKVGMRLMVPSHGWGVPYLKECEVQEIYYDIKKHEVVTYVHMIPFNKDGMLSKQKHLYRRFMEMVKLWRDQRDDVEAYVENITKEKEKLKKEYEELLSTPEGTKKMFG